jgi:rod shape-determining protein MreD
MRWALTALGLLLALGLQTGLSLVLPQQSRLFDPFLLVVVYCGLAFGETHGMLAGAVAGWIQDLQFGGAVTGLSALTKLLVGFVVGAAATRFLIVAATTRFLVVFAATLLDALVFERFAHVFDVPASSASAGWLFARGALNALLGTLLFHAVDNRVKREATISS